MSACCCWEDRMDNFNDYDVSAMCPKWWLFPRAMHVYKICILAMPLTFCGEVSPNFGHGNAKSKSSFISLEIACFHGLQRRNICVAWLASDWLRHCNFNLLFLAELIDFVLSSKLKIVNCTCLTNQQTSAQKLLQKSTKIASNLLASLISRNF